MVLYRSDKKKKKKVEGLSYLPIAVERKVVAAVATRLVTVVVPGWQLEKPPLRPVDDFDRFAAIKTKKKQV